MYASGRGIRRQALLAGACASVLASLALPARASVAPTVAARVAWRFDGGAPGQFSALGMAASAGRVAIVFLRGDAGQIATLSGATGKVRWRRPLGGGPSLVEPVALDARLVVAVLRTVAVVKGRGVVRYALVARDVSSGRLRWRGPVVSRSLSPEQLVLTRRDVLAVWSLGPWGPDAVWAISRATGRVRWRAQVPHPLRSPLPALAVIASDRAIVFWANPHGPSRGGFGVDCLSLRTGRRLWRRRVSAGKSLVYQRGLSGGGRAILLWQEAAGPDPWQRQKQVRAMCFRSTTGKRLWTTLLPYGDYVFLHQDALYGLAGNAQDTRGEHTLWRADVRTGKLQETLSAPPALHPHSATWTPLVSRGIAVIADPYRRADPSQVMWVDLRTGDVLGAHGAAPSRGPGSSPVLSGRLVICEVGQGHAVEALALSQR